MKITQHELSTEWNGIDTIIIYGLGSVADRFIDKILQDFNVLYIIDRQKQGMRYSGIPVVGYEAVKNEIKRKKLKIVVMTSQRVYSEIRNILKEDGLEEYSDFCKIEQFAVEWYYTNRNMTNIIQVNTAVTTWCTLNCKKCNMFMPYYDNKKRKNFSFNEMKEDVDLLLMFVDYIFLYSFLGGEPFLNKEIKNIIAYIGEKYKTKIGKLGLTTNGTVIPDDEILQTLKKYDVMVSVSDYTQNVPYKERIDAFIEKLKMWNISYTRNVMTEWKDFGFPDAPFHWGKKCVYEHMKNCSPLFHGVNDKKLYYCHVIWSADKAGIYTAPKQDYIDLTELNPQKKDDKRKVCLYCIGNCEDSYLDFCVVCGGCGEDNERVIPAGEQTNGKNQYYYTCI